MTIYLLSYIEEKQNHTIWNNMRQVHFTVKYPFKWKSLCVAIKNN